MMCDLVTNYCTECKERQDRIEKLECLIRVLLDNDPNDSISDAGHTVLDLWRHEARQALQETNNAAHD